MSGGGDPMRALVITGAGGPECLALREVPRPEPGPGEVVVAVQAAGLNRADLLQLAGRYPAPPDAPADIPGLEYAGVIAATGAGVNGWRPGDRVFGIASGGTHAEFVRVPADTLAALPDALPFAEAAAIPEAFITAHDAMVTQAGFATGSRLLVSAVGSGVGLAAVQLAVALGGDAFGTSRTAEKLARAKSYGMTAGCEDGDPAALVAAVREWSGGRGADVLVDLVGGTGLPGRLAALAPKGTAVIVGLVAGRTASLDLGLVLAKRLTLRGTVLRSRSVEEKAAATAAFARDVVPLVTRGTVRPVVEAVLPFAQAADAYARMASDATFGKLVLTW
jgi:putative PIG3 family NAD(P)H quinone oxidoreductase